MKEKLDEYFNGMSDRKRWWLTAAGGFIGFILFEKMFNAIFGEGALGKIIFNTFMAILIVGGLIWMGIDDVVNVHDINTKWVADQVWSIKSTAEHGLDRQNLGSIEDRLNDIYQQELDQGKEPISRAAMVDPDMWVTKVGLSTRDANMMADLSARIFY